MLVGGDEEAFQTAFDRGGRGVTVCETDRLESESQMVGPAYANARDTV